MCAYIHTYVITKEIFSFITVQIMLDCCWLCELVESRKLALNYLRMAYIHMDLLIFLYAFTLIFGDMNAVSLTFRTKYIREQGLKHL